ncbi:MAG: NACHT domain-containing protein [Trichormus sp. ATA11-4-KO1]|jgi:hypothetical protein|nr:NACHT domain-containing protein [Trichormus sp. ATA11-4-KO1]
MNLSNRHEVEPQSSFTTVVTRKQPSELPSLETVTFQEVLDTVNNLIFAQKNRYLSDTEIIVLKGTWDSQDFNEIAQQSGYSINYIQRRIAPQLWNLLSETIAEGEPVVKRKVRALLTQVATKYHPQSSSKSEDLPFDSNFVRGQLPLISNFYGRQQELSQLKTLINNHRCVSLIGVPGIGKSILSARLLAELSIESPPRFDLLIWKSVTHAVSIQELVTDLIKLIQPLEPYTNLPEYNQAIITVLIQYLRSHRCLLVLDSFETLFKTLNLEQRLEYRILVRRLLEEEHQSSLLLTCRTLPNELTALFKNKRSFQCFKIEGLDTNSAMQFLTDQGLTDQEKCLDIINTYRGNPSELNTIMQRIQHFFAGSTEKFFQHKTTFISDEFKSMLDEMFGEVLDEVERYIMIYLAEKTASNIQSTSFDYLLNEINNNRSISTSVIIKALEKLERLLLIESIKDENTKEISFTLQPIIRKYVAKDLLGLVHKSDPQNFKIAS